MKKLNKIQKALLAGAFVALSVGQASAATQDWSGVSTSVTAEIAAVMPIALTIFGAIIAVMIGKKVFKAIAK